MSDISITPGSVVAGADSVNEFYTAGATITAGQLLQRDELCAGGVAHG